MAGIDKGEGSRDSVEMGRLFPHIGKFWTFAPLHLRKQSARPRPQPCLALTPALNGENDSFSHARPPLCVCTVYAQLCLTVTVCFCVFSAQSYLSFTQENATHLHTKRGLCGNPLKETKISLQTEAKCCRPQIFMRLCHRW